MRNYIGLFLAAACLASAAPVRAQVFDVKGFEGYGLGAVAGQGAEGGAPAGAGAWEDYSSTGQPAGTIVNNAFTQATGHGNVLELTPTGQTTGDRTLSYLRLPQDLLAAGPDIITIDFDQFRGTVDQTMFIQEEASRQTSSYVGYQYGLDGRFYPHGTPGGTEGGFDVIPTGSMADWHHFRLELDYVNGTVTAYMDGSPLLDFTDGSQPTDVFGNVKNAQPFLPNGTHFHGLGFAVFGAPGVNGPNYIDNLVFGRPTTGVIPEPGTMALLAFGLAPMALRRRRTA